MILLFSQCDTREHSNERAREKCITPVPGRNAAGAEQRINYLNPRHPSRYNVDRNDPRARAPVTTKIKGYPCPSVNDSI